jgi:hypothetical protein
LDQYGAIHEAFHRSPSLSSLTYFAKGNRTRGSIWPGTENAGLALIERDSRCGAGNTLCSRQRNSAARDLAIERLMLP